MRLDIDSAVSTLPVVENSVAEVNSDISRVLKQGVAAAQSGDRPMARTLLLKVTEADPNNVDAWLWLASISEYPEELLVFLNKVLEIDPNNSRALMWKSATGSLLAKTHVQRGQTAMQENQKEYAMQCFDKAIETDPNCEMAWFWKASLLEDENEKLECLERALSLNPENEDTVAAVKNIESDRSAAKMHDIKVLASVGDHAQANEMLSGLLESEPENTEAWVLRSHLARSFDDKFDAYDNILKYDPSNVFAQYGFNFLSELAESVKPAQEIKTDSEQAVTYQVEVDSNTEPEGAETSVTVANFGQTKSWESNDDAMVTVDSSAPKHLEDSTTFETKDEPESTDRFSEKMADESQTTSVPMAEVDDEPVAVAPEAMEFTASEPSFENENEPNAEPNANLYQFSVSPVEPSAEVNYFSESNVSAAFRETADGIGPFGEEVSGMDFPSFVNEEPDQESVAYASPFAETQTFQADSFAYDDPLDTDELSAIHETVASPFRDDSSAYSEPEPWSSRVDEVRSEPEADLGRLPESVFVESNEPVDFACPFCQSGIEPQSFSCGECHAVLTLSDLESLLANEAVNRDSVRTAVTRMEADKNSREFTDEELKQLGIGHFNLKNFDLGLAYLQETSRNKPNDVILASQLNTLAIRLGEIRRQAQDLTALPKGKTILVVDDSATVRKLISTKLEKCGHNVLCAVDGVEAMEMIANVTPDLVLLDITMPRMDGYQVCKQIRALDRAKDVPVVMISGRDGFFDKVRGRMAGSTDHITKPFGPETLMKTLETYLVTDDSVGR